jgi:hypothetical protein
MSIGDVPQSHWAPWFRKHDKPGNPLIPQAPTIFYPRNLVDLITICRDHPPNMRLHAAGSHWALSEAAVSDSGFIETHDWNEIFPTMGRTLYDVVPNCLTDDFLAELNEIPPSPISKSAPFYLVHIESGKRIYQLYAELDVGEGQLPGSLADVMKQRFGNDLFDGSWGFPTLGGAGGQTVVGALSTGTHGGDFDRPPVADSVVALHVVVDGGKHYWIEPALFERTPFVDEAKLRAFYGQPQFGGPDNFDVLYDTQVFRAALVQVGRFGAVYSAVLKVLPQYGLYQTVRFDHWENVRSLIDRPELQPIRRTLRLEVAAEDPATVSPDRRLSGPDPGRDGAPVQRHQALDRSARRRSGLAPSDNAGPMEQPGLAGGTARARGRDRPRQRFDPERHAVRQRRDEHSLFA